MEPKRCKIEPETEEAEGALLAVENGDNEGAECNKSNENGELQSPQAQTRWTPECTRLMLQMRFERQLEFQQRLRQKKELWSEIATEMRRQGLCDSSLTAEACDLKYRNMLQTYKKNRLKEDSGLQSLIAWEYYELFKEALTAGDDLEAAQVGQDRVVPSLLCESVCEAGNEDEAWLVANEIDSELSTAESVADPPKVLEDIDSMSNMKPAAVISRKRSRRCALNASRSIGNLYGVTTATTPVKTEAINPAEQETTNLTDNLKGSFSYAASKEEPLIFNGKSDTADRPQRRRAAIPSINIDDVAVGPDPQIETPLATVHNGPIISSASTLPIPPVMHASTTQPQMPPTVVPPLNQTPITMVQSDPLQAIPIGLAPSEMRECLVFGESIGLQLAHVRESHTRAMVQYKIQELLYLAKTGKLVEPVRV
ncbi:PREDICTED: uncharacterized protein LOC108371930 [Rhagoletis zephyria]|uniref:uncharacterized protein LOC108371930 n=1 Tax=Rhagoletis zephyria TaxID=28612 RepID=UPI0008114176|nr:PREDICTED: uncharacterized protein LOC108371930 [Rhagoletis zephyria]